MKKWLSGYACIGYAVVAVLAIAALMYQTAGIASAGERANSLVTIEPGKVVAFGIKTGVTGTSTFTVTGVGTVEKVIPGLTEIKDDVRYVCGTSSAGNITLKVYGIGAGTSTTLSTTSTNVEYIIYGTP